MYVYPYGKFRIPEGKMTYSSRVSGSSMNAKRYLLHKFENADVKGLIEKLNPLIFGVLGFYFSYLQACVSPKRDLLMRLQKDQYEQIRPLIDLLAKVNTGSIDHRDWAKLYIATGTVLNLSFTAPDDIQIDWFHPDNVFIRLDKNRKTVYKDIYDELKALMAVVLNLEDPFLRKGRNDVPVADRLFTKLEGEVGYTVNQKIYDPPSQCEHSLPISEHMPQQQEETPQQEDSLLYWILTEVGFKPDTTGRIVIPNERDKRVFKAVLLILFCVADELRISYSNQLSSFSWNEGGLSKNNQNCQDELRVLLSQPGYQRCYRNWKDKAIHRVKNEV